MARLEIDFERELRIERRQVVVTVSVEHVGRTSIVLNGAILDAEGATAESARTTIVAWEPGERRPLPIDDELRARLLGGGSTGPRAASTGPRRPGRRERRQAAGPLLAHCSDCLSRAAGWFQRGIGRMIAPPMVKVS